MAKFNSIKELKECLRVEMGKRSKMRILYEALFASVGGYIIFLRLVEYCSTKRTLIRLFGAFFRWRLSRVAVITGIHIPPGTCDKGLTVHHFGSIVVNSATRIGRNCCIQNNVNIGATRGSSEAPRIGDNVYIGPGAVIFGDIEIADGCWIGANAVINKSVTEPNSVVVGVPGKVIKHDTKVWWEYNRLNREK